MYANTHRDCICASKIKIGSYNNSNFKAAFLTWENHQYKKQIHLGSQPTWFKSQLCTNWIACASLWLRFLIHTMDLRSSYVLLGKLEDFVFGKCLGLCIGYSVIKESVSHTHRCTSMHAHTEVNPLLQIYVLIEFFCVRGAGGWMDHRAHVARAWLISIGDHCDAVVSGQLARTGLLS